MKKILITSLALAFAFGTIFAQSVFACSDVFISPQRKCPKSLIKVD